MGVLATLAAALFPDYVAGTYTGYSPKTADLRSFAAAIDNAIPNAQDLNARFGGTTTTVAAIEQYAHAIDDKYDTEFSVRFGTSSTVGAIESYAHQVDEKYDGLITERFGSTTSTVSDVEATASAAAAAAASAVATAEGEAAARLALASIVADLQATVPLNARPGDNPNAFTTDLYAGSTGLPPIAVPVTGIGGQSLRVTGAVTLGNIGLRAIEPNRLYKVRCAFRRVVDTADPAGAAVTFAVAWYGADRNLMVQANTEVATVRLAVASGRVQYEALFSPNPPDQTDLSNPRVAQPPVGAAYLRPFLRTFAADVVTDLEVLEHADVTDAAMILPPPMDMLLARLSRVEAALNLPAM